MDERQRRENLERCVQNPRNELYIEGLLVSVEMFLSNCHAIKQNEAFINWRLVFSLGRHSVVGQWLWLSSPEKKQECRKLPSKMWVCRFAVALFTFNGFSSSSLDGNFFFFSDEKPSKVIEQCRMNANDFYVIKVIGRGAFGEVQLVSCNN